MKTVVEGFEVEIKKVPRKLDWLRPFSRTWRVVVVRSPWSETWAALEVRAATESGAAKKAAPLLSTLAELAASLVPEEKRN